MKTIKVVHYSTQRDGGTVIYKNKEGISYYVWKPTGKIYGNHPYPDGNGRFNPVSKVEELKVKLEVVKSF